jgi:hypothetical protein
MPPLHPIYPFQAARGALMVPPPGCLPAYEEISGRVLIRPIEISPARAPSLQQLAIGYRQLAIVPWL